MISVLFNTLMESAPYVVLGFLIAGILRFWVPANMLQKHLGGRSFGTLMKSVGMGCVLPLCSCGTIPLGIGLFRSGASVGNMLAFMTSTPMLSPVLIALSLKLLGFKLSLSLLISAVLGALIMGILANYLFAGVKAGGISKTDLPKKETSYLPQPSGRQDGKVAKTIKWAFLDLGADVSVDILIGLAVASLLISVLPLEWISRWLGQQDLFTLLYVVLGIPVYACSIPSLAVVQGLLLMGASPGAGIAYMIAGPATNLGELNAIRKAMGSRPAIFYMLFLLFLALLAGYVTDHFVFPDYQYHAYRLQGELVVKQCCVPLIFGDTIDSSFSSKLIPVWHWPFGALLLGILLYGTAKKVRWFFVNPCRSCSWRIYGADGYCGSRCHIRRKYEFFRRIRFSRT